MIRLVINGRDADVLQTETIVGEYAIAPIGDISKRVGARSIQFKLPKTATNKAIFESSEIATSTSKIPYRNLPCRIYVDGVDMNMQFCILESVDDNYNIRMYGGNSDLFYNLKNKKLSELDLRKYNHYWDLETIRDSFTNTEGYIYSIIDFNINPINIYVPPVGSTIKPNTLHPSIFKRTVMKEIIEQSGLILDDGIDYNGTEPCEILGANKFIRDYDGNRYNGKFGVSALDDELRSWRDIDLNLQPYKYGQSFSFYNISQKEIFYNPSGLYAPKILINDKARVRVKGAFTLKSLGIDVPVVITLAYTADQYGDDIPITVVSEIATSSYASYYFDETIDLIENNFGSIYLSFYIDTNGETIKFDWVTSTFEILETKIIEALPIDFDGKNYVTVANNISDDNQGVYISNYLKTYNAIMWINELTKVCYIREFSDIKINIANAYDWSDKLDFTNKPKVEFDIDFAQTNRLKYKDDNTVIKPSGTDGVILVDNQNAKKENVYLELSYGASEMCERLDGRKMINIKKYDYQVTTETVVPRQFLLDRINDTITLNKFSTNLVYSGLVPYSYFIKEEKEHNFGFGNSLIADYYGSLSGVFNYTKVIECEMRLTTLDIANFEPLKPVYIREFDAHFYVNKIKFEYTSTKSSVVELIKLL